MTRSPPKQCAVTGYWGLEMTRKPAYGSATEDFAYHVSINNSSSTEHNRLFSAHSAVLGNFDKERAADADMRKRCERKGCSEKSIGGNEKCLSAAMQKPDHIGSIKSKKGNNHKEGQNLTHQI